ncbi:hypothetical protein CXF85_05570 [Colwellia sp. 75C3]|uniref:DUF4374 domain-containing protein n=1 Tax=Colwellia sp. 75C3 TaxID=888425 RepID=UPI000C3362D5|nr:DUF4374 domain-containing protein [Colwellia sp. 75C3]PKG85075.1 hypothetical protein CXF85_05570 [Colwellia sp. 75C3]
MYKLKTLGLLIATLTLSACGSSDSDEAVIPPVVVDPVIVEPGPFTFAFKITGDIEAEYLVTQDSITTEDLTADGKGIEQQKWNYFFPVGNTLFTVGYENNEATSYKVDADNKVAKLSSFEFTNTLETFASVDDKVLLATDAPRDGNHTKRTLYSVDAETGLVTSKVNYTIHDVDTGTKGEGTVGYPTALVVRGDLLFLSFHKLDDAGNWGTPEADNAFVAIYDYPLVEGATPKSIIADARTSNIGVNGNIGLIKTANGDLYSMSNGSVAVGFSPASTKPSALLRINNNEEVFDANYFFDIEAATDGGKIFWFDYVGDNKAIARIITDDTGAASWGAFTKNQINHKLVIIDLVAQTVTDIDGIPLHHKRWTSPVEIIDGKVYVSIETVDAAFVYVVDINSATATKGVEIKGKTIKGFYDLYH